MAKPYFHTIQAPSNYTSKYPTRPDSLRDLLKRGVSASSWGLDHLIACRVVIASRRPRNILPSLESIVADDVTNNDHIRNLITMANCPRDESWLLSEQQLVRKYGEPLGDIIAALGRLIHAETSADNDAVTRDSPPVSDSDLSPSPIDTDIRLASRPAAPDTPPLSHSAATRVKRKRTSASAAGYVNSGTMVVGSSPDRPPAASQESESSAFQSSLDTDAPEDLTVHFVGAFLRHALHWVLPGHSGEANDPGRCLEFQNNRTWRRAALGTASFAAVDDGGLAVRSRLGRRLLFRRVVMLEAKTRFCQQTEGLVSLSDRAFAQMVGEALAMAVEDDGRREGGVIVMAAAGYYMRILEFHIGDSYVTQFKEHLDNGNEPFDEYMHVDSTACLDLSLEDGRKSLIKNLSGLVARFCRGG